MSVGSEDNNPSIAIHLDPRTVTVAGLLWREHVLESMTLLRKAQYDFAGIFVYNNDGTTLLDNVYEVSYPPYDEQDVHSLVEKIHISSNENYIYTADGSLAVGHPIWLHGRKGAITTSIVRACFVSVSKTKPEDIQSALMMAKFIADLFSERISATFHYQVERYNCEALERELKLGDSVLASVINSAGAEIVLLDKDLRIVWSNTTFAEKYKDQCFEGKQCYKVTFNYDEPCKGCTVKQTFESGRPQSGIVTHVQKKEKREVYYHRVLTTPIFDESGQVKQVLEFIYDVTAQNRAEWELERYKRLANNSDDFMLVCDEFGMIIAANRKITAGLGFTEEELNGRNSFALLAESERDKLDATVKKLFSTGVIMDTITLMKKDGTLVPTEAFITYDYENRVFECIYRDISERIRMEKEIHKHSEQLMLQNRKVLAAIQEKNQFFRNISHELRTPLTSIIGFAELLLEDTDDPLKDRQKLALERIVGNGHKLLGMVNNLLDLSKIEAQRMTVDYSDVKLDDLLKQITSNMMPLAIEKSLRLEVEAAKDLPVIRTDEQKLGQILVNLVSNAIKFTQEGSVKLIASGNCESVSIMVQDTGAGIPEKHIKQVFNEFHQVDGQRSNYRGTGLGLTIAQKLTELLGGKISLQSEVGIGSSFTVELPIKPVVSS